MVSAVRALTKVTGEKVLYSARKHLFSDGIRTRRAGFILCGCWSWPSIRFVRRTGDTALRSVVQRCPLAHTESRRSRRFGSGTLH
jgi:hypothetical protein